MNKTALNALSDGSTSVYAGAEGAGLGSDQPPSAPPISEEEYREHVLEEYVPCYEPDSTVDSKDGPFKVLGHNDGIYYYLPRDTGQIVELTPSAHTDLNMQRVADFKFWQQAYPAKGGVGWKMAASDMMHLAHKAGIFKIGTMIRGAGVWTDRDRIVAHCGDRLVVDGVVHEPFQFASKYIYPKSLQVFEIADRALTNKQSHKLIEIFEELNWKEKISATLAAGWIVIAPLAGAMPWRPHIYLTAVAGAGKSWTNNKIFVPALGKCVVRVGSGTTEAGLRRLIGNDARPIIMDEMEGEDKKSKELRQAIIFLARKASSGESIVMANKTGGTEEFKIFSIFSMSSINSGVSQRADMMRFSSFEIFKSDDFAKFERLEKMVAETLTEDFSKGLIKRTVDNAKTILANSRVFTRAAAHVLRDQRAGDQIGPMLAGAFSLHSLKAVTHDEAVGWIKARNWTKHTAISEISDHQRLYDHIMTAKIRISGSSKIYETQIGHAIQVALGQSKADFFPDDARNALDTMDIKVKGNEIWIRKPSQHIERLLRDTPWEISWSKSLMNLEGITCSDAPKRFGASSANVVIIPEHFFTDSGQIPLGDFEQITV